MRIQQTDWGYIEWMDPEPGTDYHPALKMGMVHSEAGSVMLPHIHYEEQFLYVLEGRAISYADGIPQEFTPGTKVHMAPGCLHELHTSEDGPLIHLMISTPQVIEDNDLLHLGAPDTVEEAEDYFYEAVANVADPLLNRSHIACVIRDCRGRILRKSDHFPPFCEETCQISRSEIAPCLQESVVGNSVGGTIFTCPSGLTMYQVPVLWEGIYLGQLLGGYIRRSHGYRADADFYETPESGGQGLQQLLRRVAGSITNYCGFDYFRKKLFEQERSLRTYRDTSRQLESSLRNAEHTATSLRINNHFLFNTLNSMASLALDGGQMELYQSIIDLSKMLRYSVRIQDTLVPLRTELDYLESYLKLQRLRYPSGFRYKILCEPELMELPIPFNILQPIVENAFTHGFQRKQERNLRVYVDRAESSLLIHIRNNGLSMSSEEIDRVHFQIRNETNHGLSMLYGKLKNLYGGSFTMEFLKDTEETTMRLVIPVERGEKV